MSSSLWVGPIITLCQERGDIFIYKSTEHTEALQLPTLLLCLDIVDWLWKKSALQYIGHCYESVLKTSVYPGLIV